LSQFKKYHPSGNLEFNNLGIFQSLKLHILMEKILPISLKLNFTPNTLGSYGLMLVVHTPLYFVPARVNNNAVLSNYEQHSTKTSLQKIGFI